MPKDLRSFEIPKFSRGSKEISRYSLTKEYLEIILVRVKKKNLLSQKWIRMIFF